MLNSARLHRGTFKAPPFRPDAVTTNLTYFALTAVTTIWPTVWNVKLSAKTYMTISAFA